MTGQLSFDDPCARLTDPVTSHEAARSVAPRAGTDRAKVLQTLLDAGQPITDFKLAELLGRAQTSVGVRRGELTRQGLVEAAGIGTSPSQSKCITWRLTVEGRRVAQGLDTE